jgi:hypothetical protein
MSGQDLATALHYQAATLYDIGAVRQGEGTMDLLLDE